MLQQFWDIICKLERTASEVKGLSLSVFKVFDTSASNEADFLHDYLDVIACHGAVLAEAKKSARQRLKELETKGGSQNG